MSYRAGQYGHTTGLSRYPVMSMPTGAMRAYAQNDGSANPGTVGAGITAGGAGGNIVAVRLGLKRGMILTGVGDSGGVGGFAPAD